MPFWSFNHRYLFILEGFYSYVLELNDKMNWYKISKLIDKAAPNPYGRTMLQPQGRESSFTICEKCGRTATHETQDYTENRDEWEWKEDKDLDDEETIQVAEILKQIRDQRLIYHRLDEAIVELRASKTKAQNSDRRDHVNRAKAKLKEIFDRLNELFKFENKSIHI